MNEDETLWNENESARPEEIPAEDVLPEERPAEDGLPEGVPAEEPTVIGGSIPPMYGSPSFPEEMRAEHVSEVEEPAEQPVAPPRPATHHQGHAGTAGSSSAHMAPATSATATAVPNGRTSLALMRAPCHPEDCAPRDLRG